MNTIRKAVATVAVAALLQWELVDDVEAVTRLSIAGTVAAALLLAVLVMQWARGG